MRVVETDVLIVGAGPAGLTSAIALASQGVAAIAISRHSGTAPTPRAHVTNQRTMEVFRDLGIEGRIQEVGWPLSFLRHNVMTTSLSGMELVRWKSYGSAPDRLSDHAAASPCDGYNAPQHVMEPVLLAVARERGADVRFLNELVEIEQTADGVSARILERDGGAEYLIKAKYAIGADGARSRVAEQMGFEFKGQAGLRTMCNAWLEADLTAYTAHRPGVLYGIYRPDGPNWFGTATWANMRPWNEWNFMQAWDPALPLPSEDEVIAKARLTIGDSDITIRVKAISTWEVNNVVATQYRKGRVFLAGDACHRHPPSGGLGTNTSLQDAYSLAWRLALVLSGKAGDALLDSYEAERQPVGAQVVERAIQSFHNTALMVEAFGLQSDQTKAEGWAALHGLFSDGPESSERREKLAAAVRRQYYRSNALGVELGQRYASSAVVDDGTPFREPEGDPELYYRPTTHPGACLPHAWIEHEKREVSTHDLVGQGRFTLIVGIGGAPWADAARQVAEEFGIDLPVRAIGARCAFDDVTNAWKDVREVGDEGALLVRPDRFVAWRSMGAVASPCDALRSALRQVLGVGVSASAPLEHV